MLRRKDESQTAALESPMARHHTIGMATRMFRDMFRASRTHAGG